MTPLESEATSATSEKNPNKNYNLLFLTVAAILFALITTMVSVFIYTASGDIYLDRSRPGFISKEEKTITDGEINSDSSRSFSPEGHVDKKVLKKYLKSYNINLRKIQNADYAFPDGPISDESLGIYHADEAAN